MQDKKCESCFMPFSKDPGQRESDKYCSYCFKNGKFTYEGNDVNEFKRESYKAMRAKGMNPIMAKLFTWMIGFAPRWKK
jgi:hypothetical protein